MLRAGIEPATCRLGADNRIRSGPQRWGRSSRSWSAIGTRSRTAQPFGCSALEITRPLRPATKSKRAGPPGVEPGPTRLELVVLPLHHGPGKRTTRLERASSGWRPDALPVELRPHQRQARPAGVEPASSAFARQRSSAQLRAFEGASGRNRTRTSSVRRACAPVDTTEASADGWSRTITAGGAAFTGRRACRCSASAREDRPGSNRRREDHDLECFRYTTALRENGDDRDRTGDLAA